MNASPNGGPTSPSPWISREGAEAPKEEGVLPRKIDQVARDDPDRLLFILTQSLDSTDGSRPVSFAAFSRAVNRMAAWLEANLGLSRDFPTVAFMSHPFDIRYVITVVAGMKTGYKVLLPSVRNSDENHLHLLSATNCQTIISEMPLASLLERSGCAKLAPPSVEELLEEGEVREYRLDGTFEELEHRPAFVLHSSGSTGPPKPITWSHGTISAVQGCTKVPVRPGVERVLDMYLMPGVHLSLLPLFHTAGVIYSFIHNVYKGATHTFLPPKAIPNADAVARFLKTHRPTSLFAAPSILEDMTADEALLKTLEDLEFVHYGGAPIADEAGRKVARCVRRLRTSVGSTESGCYPSYVPAERDAFNYFRWLPNTPGVEFRPHEDGLFELVFKRCDFDWACFHTFPELDEYPTKDLYEPHPTLPDHWKLVARTDDVLLLSNGEKVVPLPMEGVLRLAPEVTGALVVGSHRFTTAALIELDQDLVGGRSAQQMVQRLQKYIEKANREAPGHARLSPDRILFTKPDKPMVRTAKGSVVRSVTANLYEAEIELLYSETGTQDADSTIVKGLSEAETQQILKSVIKETTGLTLETDDADFFESGFDSNMVLTLNRRLKRSIQNELPDHAGLISPGLIYANPNVFALASALNNLRDGNSTISGDDSVRRIEMALTKYSQKLLNADDGDIKRRDGRLFKTAEDKLTVVLTGTTGSLGSYLLHELVSKAEVTRIFALNRKADSSSRQRSINAARGLSTDFSKVTFLPTTLSQSELGLETRVYREMLDTVDTVIHNAWLVDFNQRLESFEPHIQGVVNLINFSVESTRRPHILFVSSVSTTGNWARLHPGQGVPEELIGDARAPLDQGYAQSKYVCEHLLASAARCGISASVCRVGQVAGPVERQLGEWGQREWLPSLVLSSQQLALLPSSLGQNDSPSVDWIPVDLVARILVELTDGGGDIDNDGRSSEKVVGIRTFNLVNRTPVSWSSLLPDIRRRMPQGTRVVPFADWLSTLHRACERADAEPALRHPPAGKLMPFWEAMESAPPASSLATDRTAEASHTMARVPPVSASWMNAWMRQWGFDGDHHHRKNAGGNDGGKGCNDAGQLPSSSPAASGWFLSNYWVGIVSGIMFSTAVAYLALGRRSLLHSR